MAPEESHEKTIRAEMRGILPVLSGGWLLPIAVFLYLTEV